MLPWKIIGYFYDLPLPVKDGSITAITTNSKKPPTTATTTTSGKVVTNGVVTTTAAPLTTTTASLHTTTTSSLPKAMVKPQVLTHVIEGYVIHEGESRSM